MLTINSARCVNFHLFPPSNFDLGRNRWQRAMSAAHKLSINFSVLLLFGRPYFRNVNFPFSRARAERSAGASRRPNRLYRFNANETNEDRVLLIQHTLRERRDAARCRCDGRHADERGRRAPSQRFAVIQYVGRHCCKCFVLAGVSERTGREARTVAH